MTDNDSPNVDDGTEQPENDRIEQLEAAVETLAERVVELETERAERGGPSGGSSGGPISRRSVLGALGIAGLAGLGATTASADPQGQVGTESDPLRSLSVEAIDAGHASTEFELSVGGDRALLLGQEEQTQSLAGSVVLGHSYNSATGAAATISGGGRAGAPNGAGRNATVGGGNGNDATGNAATVAGGITNEGSGRQTAIGGGNANAATALQATVGGGLRNAANADHATVAGGIDNTADATNATVGGGNGNEASGENAVVAGGTENLASGARSSVLGGEDNLATGNDSVVLGRAAAAENEKAFVWNDGLRYHDIDSTQGNDALSSNLPVDGEPVTGNGTFTVGASGGVRFVTGASAVTYVDAASTGWSTTSTRASKTNVDPIDPESVLDGVESLEVATWEYKDEDGEGAGTTHLGPMAEDFHDAFDVGSSDDHINSINADGVALAAIQGLAEREAATTERVEATEERVDDAEQRIDAADDRVAELEAENEALRSELEELRAEVEFVQNAMVAADGGEPDGTAASGGEGQ